MRKRQFNVSERPQKYILYIIPTEQFLRPIWLSDFKEGGDPKLSILCYIYKGHDKIIRALWGHFWDNDIIASLLALVVVSSIKFVTNCREKVDLNHY